MSKTKVVTVVDASTATGWGTQVDVRDYDEVVFMLDMTSGTATVKFAGTADDTVDFTSAASASNFWDYIDVTDAEDGSSVDGDTGISTSTSADHRLLKASTKGLTVVNAQVSAYTSGTINVKMSATDTD